MRSQATLSTALALALAGALVTMPAAAQPCSRADFESVVDQASGLLRDLVQRNTAEFQGKLRALRQKRGWSQEQFVKEGARFVQDEKIAEFDEQSARLLAKINQGGDSGGKTPDCAVLGELRATMKSLVEVQEAKWRHMNDEIDAEMAK